MKTSEELWDEVEAAYDRAVESCVPEYEKRVDTRVLFELSLRWHEAAIAELDAASKALEEAAERVRVARQSCRRAALTMFRAARNVAATNTVPLGTVLREALEREGFREPG